MITRLCPRLLFCLVAIGLQTLAARAADYGLFARSNIVAWCIVPFDAKKRGPEERAAMLEKLRIPALAYDYRAEHIPTFEEEILALKRHNVRLHAWWFPTTLNEEGRQILRLLKKHDIHAQLWVMGSGGQVGSQDEQTRRVAEEASRIAEIAKEAAAIKCQVGLYNHGGWFGEPENQIAIIERLKTQGLTNVGIVYNLHHGHDHLARFPELLRRMKPHLLTLNLNGMEPGGDKAGKKILPIAQGSEDQNILKTILKSGWRGPVGILNHTDEDAEARLLDNLEGLEWVTAQLNSPTGASKPKPRTRAPGR